MKRQGQKKEGGRASREKWVRQVGKSVCKNYVANLTTVDAKIWQKVKHWTELPRKRGQTNESLCCNSDVLRISDFEPHASRVSQSISIRRRALPCRRGCEDMLPYLSWWAFWLTLFVEGRRTKWNLQ